MIGIWGKANKAEEIVRVDLVFDRDYLRDDGSIVSEDRENNVLVEGKEVEDKADRVFMTTF